MARISKSNALKSKVKLKGSKLVTASGDGDTAQKKGIKLVELSVSEPSIKQSTTKPASPEMKSPTTDKKVSQKLLETIERRKKAQGPNKGGSPFGKPAGRRGRRPKASLEYVPGNQEEEAYVLESDYEGLEQETGIRVKEGGEDKGAFAMDRFDDYEEELNFDW